MSHRATTDSHDRLEDNIFLLFTLPCIHIPISFSSFMIALHPFLLPLAKSFLRYALPIID